MPSARWPVAPVGQTCIHGGSAQVAPNFDAAEVHPAGGKVCVKAYGLIQKSYNPHRILHPMRRTNPKKGRHEDPGFVRISWEEALSLVAEKLNTARVCTRFMPRLRASACRVGPSCVLCGLRPIHRIS